jgi:hypothetical protein
MNRSTQPGTPPDGSPTPKPEAIRGLEDPRAIHPSPDGVFPDPAGTPEVERSPAPEPSGQSDSLVSNDVDAGMVDPRDGRIGPDL